MTDIHLNHDGYFKRNYSRLEIAIQHLNQYFPPEVVRLLDLTTLKICKDSYIDPQMKKYFSDLLYQVKLKLGTDLYVYILCEHKSTPEPLVAFQLLRYMMKIWEKTSEGGKKRHFPIIIPYVFYHGKKEWKISKKFLELLQCPKELKHYVPQFEYELFDLTRLQNDDIQGVPELQATLMTMKHIFGPELEDVFQQVCDKISEFEDKDFALVFLETTLKYISNAADKIREGAIKEGIHRAIPDQGEKVMATLGEKWKAEGIEIGREEGRKEALTLGEKWKAEGIEIGRKEGWEEGRKEGLLDAISIALEIKFGDEGLALFPQIEKITSIEKLNGIKSALRSADTLDQIKVLLSS